MEMEEVCLLSFHISFGHFSHLRCRAGYRLEQGWCNFDGECHYISTLTPEGNIVYTVSPYFNFNRCCFVHTFSLSWFYVFFLCTCNITYVCFYLFSFLQMVSHDLPPRLHQWMAGHTKGAKVDGISVRPVNKTFVHLHWGRNTANTAQRMETDMMAYIRFFFNAFWTSSQKQLHFIIPFWEL